MSTFVEPVDCPTKFVDPRTLLKICPADVAREMIPMIPEYAIAADINERASQGYDFLDLPSCRVSEKLVDTLKNLEYRVIRFRHLDDNAPMLRIEW